MPRNKQIDQEAAQLARSMTAWLAEHAGKVSSYSVALAAIKLSAAATAACHVPLDVVNSTYLEHRNIADEMLLNQRPR